MSASVAPKSLESLYLDARRRLSEAGIANPELDTSLLMEHATGFTVLSRLMEPGRVVPAHAIDTFEDCIARRLRREPVHRIIGEREFYGLPLKLNPATLVPRPDTETLVDLVLPYVEDTAARSGICRILDFGTGSGAIALALLAEVPQAIAIGSDMAVEALDMAEANAEDLGLDDRFSGLLSDGFAGIVGEFDLIVSNPPYIRSDDIAGLDADVRDHDPSAALDGGPDGLDFYRMLAMRGGAFLAAAGAIAVEIGYDQKREVAELFIASGYRLAADRKDYNGHDRALFFVK